MSQESHEEESTRHSNRQPQNIETYSGRVPKNYKTIVQGDNNNNRDSDNDSPVGNLSLLSHTFNMVVFDIKLDYVLKDLLGVPIGTATDPTLLSLDHHGISKWPQFFKVKASIINNLHYVDNDIPKYPAKRIIDELQSVRNYRRNLLKEGDTDADDPTKWDVPEYENWVAYKEDDFLAGLSGNVPAAPAAAVATAPSNSGVNSWKKVRRDHTKFDKLVNDDNYYQWLADFNMMAVEQDFDRIMDPNLKRTTLVDNDDRALWDLQENYLHIVLKHTLVSPMGKVLLTSHSDSPRRIWFEHHEYQTTSLVASSRGHNLTTKLSNLKITSCSTRVEFIEKFVTIIEHHELVAKVPMTDEVKVDHLTMAILGEKALNTALSSWNQSRIDTKITTAISYQDFLSYVLQTCINQDRFHPIKPNRHHAMVAAFDHPYDDYDDSDDDSTDNVLQAFVANHCAPQVIDEYNILAAQRRNNRNQKRKPFNRAASIASPIYRELPADFRQLWMKLDDETKIKILNHKRDGVPDQKNSKLETSRSAYLSSVDYSDYCSDSDDDGYATAAEGATYDADDDAEDNVVIAKAATTSSKQKSILKKAKQKRSDMSPGSAIAMLSDKSVIARDENGDIAIVGRRPSAQMIAADRAQQGRKAKKHVLTLSANVARTVLQNLAPIHYHRFDAYFDDIDTHQVEEDPVVYDISARSLNQVLQALGLVDGGANGGIADGRTMRLMYYNADGDSVNVSGVGNHMINNLRLGTFCTVAESHIGLVLLVFHNYAYIPTQHGTIHSRVQLQDYGNVVCDTSTALGGLSRIDTVDGHRVPLVYRQGLPYIKQRRPIDIELTSLPHIIMTSETRWDPRKYDDSHLSTADRLLQIPSTPIDITDEFYNRQGDVILANRSVSWNDPITKIQHIPSNDESFFLAEQPPDTAIDLQSATCHKSLQVTLSTGDIDTDDIFYDCLDPSEFLDDISINGSTIEPYNDWHTMDDMTTRLVHQGILDNCKMYDINAGDLETALDPILPRISKPSLIDYEAKRPWFAFLPADNIKRTLQYCTQMCRLPPSTHLQKRFKSPSPGGNLRHRRENDATDMIYCDTPAKPGGFTRAHIFYGTTSRLTTVHEAVNGLALTFLGALQDRVRQFGCAQKLVADNAPLYRGWRITKYLRDTWMSLWQCESKYQHQNPAEGRYKQLKRLTNRLMDRFGVPASRWFLCMSYICFILNHTVDPNLGDGTMTPHMMATFEQSDVSPILCFHFWQPVYCLEDESLQHFPSKSKELRGRFVGIAEHIGHLMTFLILTDDTEEVIARSVVRPATEADTINLRQEPQDIVDHFDSKHVLDRVNTRLNSDGIVMIDEPVSTDSDSDESTWKPIVYLKADGEIDTERIWKEFEIQLLDEDGNPRVDENGEPIMAVAMNPLDIETRVFLTKPDIHGNVKRARVVEMINEFDTTLETNEQRKKFIKDLQYRVVYDQPNHRIDKDHPDDRDSAFDDIMSYNEICDYLNREVNNENGELWQFRTILGHEHTPINHPNRKNSEYNIQVLWENGSTSHEPLAVLKQDIPVDLAIYGKDNNLLSLPGWKSLKRLAKRAKLVTRLIKQAKLRSFRLKPKYKYGVEVPRDYNHALQMDKRNGNTRWQDANKLEHVKLKEYDVFIDKGKFHTSKIPQGYKKISVHTIFDVKHDLQHRARVVANGHLTDIPLESVYSGVVSLRGLRTVVFLGELNNMPTWGTDISSAYLLAKTSEKVCIKAGPEFGELEGHLLLVDKALYGLRLSGKAWNQLLSDVLLAMGFKPSKAEASIFMRKSPTRDCYEYVATYVDDLAITVADPELFINQLKQNTIKVFELKGSSELNFHLGCGFERDSTGVLFMDARRYVEKMEENYKRLFPDKPLSKRKYRQPLETNDHPELDTSAFCDEDDTEIYQSMIGSMQWAVSIGRIDIQTAVMTMSSFRECPRIGHLHRLQRMIAFLSHMKDFKIRFRVEQPDYSDVPPIPDHDWKYTPYGNPTEDLPLDAPPPLGKEVLLSHYYDANLMHDVLSGKSVTGVIHFFNKTPMQWFSKKQATSETATYGSEFLSCRTCFEQTIDIRNYLRYLGVPIHNISFGWGDNESMVNSATLPESKLHKRHNILSYHFVRNIIAAKYINLQHINSEFNIADIVSKHWSYQSVYDNILRPLFHFEGDTGLLADDDVENYFNCRPFTFEDLQSMGSIKTNLVSVN